MLNFRTPDQTIRAVGSLLKSTRAIDDLVIVNNDPTSWFQRDPSWPDAVRVIETGANLGYSGGMNAGIRSALSHGATYVLLLNSDATVSPTCVGALEQGMSSTPRAGIAGPVIVSRANAARVESAGMAYSERTGRMRLTAHDALVKSLQLPPASLVDGVTGCCMLVSRGTFERIGLLNEDYFFSFEDLEFCLRARRSGVLTVLASEARVEHEGAHSIGRTSPRRLYFAVRNHLLLANGARPSSGFVEKAARSASIVLFNLAHAVRAGDGAPVVRIGAVVRGIADYAAGRFGPDTDARTPAQRAATTTAASVAETL